MAISCSDLRSTSRRPPSRRGNSVSTNAWIPNACLSICSTTIGARKSFHERNGKGDPAMNVDTEKLRAAISKSQPPFSLAKIGHVVLMVGDLQRSVEFYTGVLGFKVSDIYG